MKFESLFKLCCLCMLLMPIMEYLTIEVTDEAVKQWLTDLQHLAYDIDDVLDDLATEAMRHNDSLIKLEIAITEIIIGGDNGLAITELKDLTNLHGKTHITGLEKVEIASNACTRGDRTYCKRDLAS
ncbi:hypothetical protein QVD17_28003 [Tagetes erecta]|uniref:Disease resistance N-terminal domain-containing protein n=1 Tax=Tagetes erecta TaxID=13708 RepID=A0AAD8KG08_TARER|nr:hypothetical protein QVD17_28003 [Tagetes erecta]